MFYTNDPISDFMNYDAHQERKFSRLPVCVICEEPIQDEHFYDIEGDFFCCECLDKLYRRNTERYAESEVEGE